MFTIAPGGQIQVKHGSALKYAVRFDDFAHAAETGKY